MDDPNVTFVQQQPNIQAHSDFIKSEQFNKHKAIVATLLDKKFEKHYGNLCTKRICLERETASYSSLRLKACCYNGRGLKENDYLNILCLFHKIIFVCESGAVQHNQLKDQVAINGMKVYNKLGKKVTVDGRGATKGGLAFIVSEELNVVANMKINERIVSLRIGTTLIIGVHLTFFDGPNSSLELEADLVIINQLIVDEKAAGNECIVMGDFNVDLKRHNSHTKAFESFLKNTNMISQAFLYDQTINYTLNNHTGIHIIDHILADNNSGSVHGVKILDDDDNQSDQHAISMDFTVKQTTNGGQPVEKNKKKRANLDIKWQCKIYYDDYTKRLDNAIQEAIDILDSTNSGVTKEEIASRANRVISKSLVNCSSKAFHELASKPKDRKRSRRRIKRQNWWDNELELLFIRVRIAYSAFKDSGWDKSLKDAYTKAKSDFRARKRHNQKLKSSQTYRLIGDLFKSNRVDF